MKKRAGLLYCCIFFCLLYIAGCASKPTVTGVWMNEEYTGQINKVLVLGITNNVSARLIFEDQFVAQLKNKGVDAIASYKV